MADIFEIAGRIHSTSQEGVATVASEILDENQNKKQSEVNVDVARHENEIHGTGGIDSRLSDVEQLAEISIGGGDAQIATGADFTNPDATKRAKVPTVGAIVDGLNDGVYDVSKRNPTAGPNSDGKFTLDYILNNANTLIPTGWRHGGMIISFVDSSDNKYVQYRCMSDSFSIDTNNWALDSEDVLIENSEFIEVKTDKEGKILWAIKIDGSIYWGAGVPQQVINYVENVIYKLGLNDVNKIITFIGELINGDNLSYILNRKVDKEDGKSLINSSYSSAVSLEENNAFLDVTTDSEGNVLSGRKKDGKLYEPNGIETSEIYTDSINLSSKALDGLIEDLEKSGFTPGTIPTKTSQLTNDSGFITDEDVPTTTSELTNDSGFITSSQIPQPVTSVIQGNNNPVTSGAVYNAILQAQIEAANVIINTGLPFIAVAASTATQEIKNVCQYVCDGVDDQEEINEAIQFVKNSGGGRVFLTRGKYFISSPIIFEGDIELCGEGMGAQFGGDPLLRETFHATYLQSTNNNDVIQVFSGRGASIHDLSISGHGAEKLETANWGVHIKGWIDICNFYNLNISDCYVAIGNDAYTDVYNIYNCSIQRNILAVLIYKPIYVRFHDNIICENFGLETYTGSFKDSTSSSTPYGDPVTYSLMGVVAIIKGSRVVIYNNTFMRSGYIFLFNPQRKMFRDNNRYPMSHISICNSASSVCVNSNLFQDSDGPSITVQEYTSGARFFSIKSNVFQNFGQGYTEVPTEDNPTYTNTNYRNRKYASGIYINANTTASEIGDNYFIRDTQYNEYAVYEEDIESPDSSGKFRLMVHGNSMVRLLGDSTNQKVRVATGCTTNKIDYNIINDF